MKATTLALICMALASQTLAQAPRVSSFGTGCAGSTGTPILAPQLRELPQIGWEFGVEILSGPPTGFAVGILGTFDTPIPGGLRPPVDLAILGMPGCTLYTGIQRQFGLLFSGGRATWSIDLPWDVSFLGYTFYQQGLVLDPGANALGLTTTNALQCVIGDYPELVITSGNPTVSTRTLAPGHWLDISSYTMKNESFHVESGDFETAWYLSSNSLIGSTDTLLHSRPEASMGPRENRIVPGRSLRLPFGIPPGTYWIGPFIDHLNEVEEWKEFPNFKTISITVTEPPTPLPDLVFPDGTPAATPALVGPGDSVDIKAFRIANQGFYPATKFSTGIYLSPWLNDIKGGTLLDSFTIGGLVQGLPFNVAGQTVTIPIDTPPGNYWLGFVVDNEEQVAELDETNNIVARLITVEAGQPDLRVGQGFSLVNPVTRPFPGFPIPVQVEFIWVKNEGMVDSGLFTIGIYFSHDSNVTVGDERMHSIDIPGLAPGEIFYEEFLNVFIPWHVPPGVWWIGCIADDANTVLESNEGNNV
ncbi:MAG: CARDB domain-containing protein, partial [Planctomycetota bacterium]